MNQEDIEKINKSAEISNALKELDSSGETARQQPAAEDPVDIAQKAREAFKEFEREQKIGHEQQSVNAPSNEEINKSLKAFELKQKVENIQKEKKEGKKENSDVPRMIRFVIKYSGGLIKEKRQAEYVLLGITVLFFLVSGYLFFGVGGKPNPPKIPDALLKQMQQIHQNQQKSIN